MKRNNAIPNNHFKKTAILYKTWFHQEPQKKLRKEKREALAKKLSPLPIRKLRPIVRCPTIRYNRKIRLGRGFTPEECKEAGLDYNYARTIGIAVDLRRCNNNEESFSMNVNRLKEYMSKITIYKNKQEAIQAGAKSYTKTILPIIKSNPTVESINPSEIASYN